MTTTTKAKRVFNFSPGPATLPEPVLRQAADEMLDWHDSGTLPVSGVAWYCTPPMVSLEQMCT